MSSTIIEILVPNNYKYTKDNMYYTFIKEIIKVTGEEISNIEFTIHYKEKFCELTDYIIDYENDDLIYIYYKLILTPQPKIDPPLFNIFIFNRVK